ncbi:MAG: cytochrome P450 [Alphaproteobacteria bacterium]|nr:cytochrome P450 [Alphaproteobacteria bacterium]
MDGDSLAFDPRSAAVMADPFPALARLRALDPVHWSAILKGWVLTRHRDVRAALHDPRLSADRITPFMNALAPARREALTGLERLLSRWAVFVDPPTHGRLRGLLNAAFRPRAIEAMEPAIAIVVDGLIDRIAARADQAGQGRCNLIADFAYPLPATVIAGILGVPLDDVDRFKDWSDDLAAFVGGAQAMPDKYERAARGIAEMEAYFRGLIDRHRRAGTSGDLLGDLIDAQRGEGRLDEDELVATAVLILFAGHETTTNLIGNGLLALLRHPDQLARLRAEPGLMESAVEEMLRYDGPAASVTRVARDAIEIGGRRIGRGDRLFLMLNAACRDPDAFVEPERFDIARPPTTTSLAFGYGIHYCVGAPLARLEARIAFERLLARFGTLALAGGPLEWTDNLVLRGVRTLDLTFRLA